MANNEYFIARIFGVFLSCFLLLSASNVTYAAKENIQEAQQVLKELGYDPGPTDGLLGPMTRDALIHYQNDNNLPATGQIDKATAEALGVQVYTPREKEGLTSYGKRTSFAKLNGELISYEMAFVNQKIIPIGASRGRLALEGKGNLPLEEGTLLTSGTVDAIKDNSVRIADSIFEVSIATKICDEIGKRSTLESFVVGDEVSITSAINSGQTISLRKGLALFPLGQFGADAPLNIACD